jgi:hypothetical protein
MEAVIEEAPVSHRGFSVADEVYREVRPYRLRFEDFRT